jgi:uncharacterized protein (DUF1778 family)
MPPKVPLNLRVVPEEKVELETAAEKRGPDVTAADVARERLRNGRRFELLKEILPKSQLKAILDLLDRAERKLRKPA